VVESIVTIVVVGALAAGSAWFYLRAQELRLSDPETPGDYEDLGERVWVNWDDPEVWAWSVEESAPRPYELEGVHIPMEED
jgi:hypothetical protein